MGTEALALPLHVSYAAAVEAVVVQAGLANALHARQAAEFQQFLQRGLFQTFGIGVYTSRRPEVVVAHGQCMHIRKFFQRGADDHGPVNLCFGHRLANGIDLFAQLGEIEMAV